MTDEMAALAALAREDLETARRNLTAGAFRHAVSRAYYGAFHAASAALIGEGYRPRSHSGVQKAFSNAFVRTGPLEREAGRVYSRLMQLRHDADYDVGRSISEGAAAAAVRDASALVADLLAQIEAT